ncbi:DUF6264 family protein [Agromyces sp. SYSU K20354]|uniref:DUF6264 family protein n=1 Tax=Agromyces cavernae TaxID=2898659 RepID=UPI001E5C607A|nr:DUF6264 family protein [Agromyces cavernae]MCD2442739.1 DUF6264 family protein [Agromyces cavernae]
MSDDEAARNTGDAGAGDGGAGAPAPTPGAAQPAAGRDERPRPQYGEYAPEGWTWQPPAAAQHTDDTPVVAAAAPVAAVAGTTATRRPVDRAWTIALLVFGVFGVIYNSASLMLLPQNLLESMQLSAAILGVEPATSFTPGPAVPTIVAIGVAVQVLLWLGAARWSIVRIRSGRLAWWVPLVAGAVAFVAVVITSSLIMASDPDFLTSLTP